MPKTYAEAREAALQAMRKERGRQVTDEGFDAGDDDRRFPGQLYEAGISYANYDEGDGTDVPELWALNPEAWKPKDRAANLLRAGALMMAEQDRILRVILSLADELASYMPPEAEDQR